MFKSLNIDPEKEDRIINSATMIFAQNGYQNASTNAIVKEAKISKGLLFHYFNSKKELYLSLYQNASDFLSEMVIERVDWNNQDIFIRLHQVSLIKLELFKKYPDLISFLLSVYNEKSPEVSMEINKIKADLIYSGFQQMFADIDVTKFKEGIDVKKAIEIIYWTFEGYANTQQQKLKSQSIDELDHEEIVAEIDSYIEVLKNSFYR
ncbi:TetR/AcrR family transcriptional regulator [Bacillus sp. 2205SS5-2]|uniref:TetR/AcrR family transcriptional regulator n=1 Tax=Bacillus sp. 2205SS5-2 TaxID=3109031 RepID=UPI0030064B34